MQSGFPWPVSRPAACESGVAPDRQRAAGPRKPWASDRRDRSRL